jgi:hypothetical protein
VDWCYWFLRILKGLRTPGISAVLFKVIGAMTPYISDSPESGVVEVKGDKMAGAQDRH